MTPLTIEQVLDAKRPACSRVYMFRYLPGRGFERAHMFTRGVGPWWLPVQGIPARDEVWYHKPGCECRYHRSGAERTIERPEMARKAA